VKIVRAACIFTGLWLCAAIALLAQGANQQDGKKDEAVAEEFRISGVVVDATSGLAVPGAELTTAGEIELKTVADGEGRFVFADVEAGKYPLVATAAGYVKEGYNQHGGFFTGIAVGSGLDSEHLIFKLHRQAVISGRVTDERGDGVRQATVWLFAEGSYTGKREIEERTHAQTDDQGGYRFAHLLPGKYYVGVLARPWYAENGFRYQTKPEGEQAVVATRVPEPPQDPLFDVVYPVTYFAGATEPEGAAELVAKAGDVLEANVRLIAVPSIHVLLTNVERRGTKNGPSVGVVAIQRPFGATVVPLGVNSAEISPGTYEVTGLPPGEVRLMINRGEDQVWGTNGVRVNAAEGETVDANTQDATASVSGTVIGVDGNKLDMQGEVVLRKTEQEAVSAMLRKDGTFHFTGVEEGTYEVQINSATNGDYVAKVAGSGAKMSGRTVKIEGTNEVKLVVTMGRGQGRVTGIVRMDGKAVAGVMILLVPQAENLTESELGELVRMDQSDSDGTFTLGGILPGKYVLVAIEDGWELEWKDAAVLKPFREKGMKVEIGAGEERNVVVEGMKKSTAASE